MSNIFGSDYDVYVRLFDANLNPIRDDLIDTSSNHTVYPAITAWPAMATSCPM